MLFVRVMNQTATTAQRAGGGDCCCVMFYTEFCGKRTSNRETLSCHNNVNDIVKWTKLLTHSPKNEWIFIGFDVRQFSNPIEFIASFHKSSVPSFSMSTKWTLTVYFIVVVVVVVREQRRKKKATTSMKTMGLNQVLLVSKAFYQKITWMWL